MKFFIVQFKGFNKILTEDELRLVWNSYGCFIKLKSYKTVELSKLIQDLYNYEEYKVYEINTTQMFIK